ncbi:hypothetical protein [Sphingomonas sp. LM7]|uniref:hypothetical protein n=1 Tax=Sphingomonas sp. LM7 TaxID=1938607 RepID=UPI000983E6F9|nr:hypothetical protein [Sphingomonas sp. LM7]AQR73153.1 hypothetical protein BXU08_05185 [Sphingomonas sp. LM7]
MIKPSPRKLLLFAVLSIGYGIVWVTAVLLTSIRVCSIQPDVAVSCDPTPVYVVALVLLLPYAWLAIRFFQSRISGVD